MSRVNTNITICLELTVLLSFSTFDKIWVFLLVPHIIALNLKNGHIIILTCRSPHAVGRMKN